MIVTDHGGYRFDAARGWVDLTEFNRLLDTALPSLDRPAIEQALALVTGELLEDEPYSDWALSARRDNQQRRLQLHVAAGELALAAGDTDVGVAHAKAAVAIEPLHEAAVRLLMTASYRGGEQAEALRVFGQLRLALADGASAADRAVVDESSPSGAACSNNDRRQGWAHRLATAGSRWRPGCVPGNTPSVARSARCQVGGGGR